MFVFAVSEKVYRDYDNLSSKYEVETSALHRALGAASKVLFKKN